MINLSLIFLLPFFHFSSTILCSKNHESLDSILHAHAVRTMHHHRHTDVLYVAPLPASLAGMEVSVLGLRSRTLWKKGANFNGITIPQNTLPTPYVKRILIVYHNLGNLSSSYYSLPGYALSTPVVGFLVYDFTSKNASRIELNTNGKPITIEFLNSFVEGRKCVEFGGHREVFLSEMRLGNVCYSRNQGHFSIVIPRKNKKKVCWIVVGLVGGFVGVFLLMGVMGVRSLMCKKNQEMEKEKEENERECLEACWIDSNKMPRAEVMRTLPILEGTSLPNPKMYAS